MDNKIQVKTPEGKTLLHVTLADAAKVLPSTAPEHAAFFIEAFGKIALTLAPSVTIQEMMLLRGGVDLGTAPPADLQKVPHFLATAVRGFASSCEVHFPSYMPKTGQNFADKIEALGPVQAISLLLLTSMFQVADDIRDSGSGFVDLGEFYQLRPASETTRSGVRPTKS